MKATVHGSNKPTPPPSHSLLLGSYAVCEPNVQPRLHAGCKIIAFVCVYIIKTYIFYFMTSYSSMTKFAAILSLFYYTLFYFHKAIGALQSYSCHDLTRHRHPPTSSSSSSLLPMSHLCPSFFLLLPIPSQVSPCPSLTPRPTPPRPSFMKSVLPRGYSSQVLYCTVHGTRLF